MAILAFAPGLQYRERKFTTPDGAAGPFLPGALLGAFPTARFRTILDIYLGLDILAYEEIWLPTDMISIADDHRSVAIVVTPRLPT